MKKIIPIALLVCVVLSIMLLSSCSIISNVENTVKYPDSYSITYEITTSEGLIHRITKTVDENGNIYFKSSESEKLFIKKDGSYALYEKNTDGEFSKTEDVKYTAEAVEKELALFDSYAKKSTDIHIPTARKTGEATVAGRTADTYRLGVNLLAVSFFHIYYVDSETGVCLGVTVENITFGNETEANEETFVCVEYLTENIENLENKISK